MKATGFALDINGTMHHFDNRRQCSDWLFSQYDRLQDEARKISRFGDRAEEAQAIETELRFYVSLMDRVI